jgi:hypothetical protein
MSLLTTLAEHPDPTLPVVSRLVGSSASCVCARLAKLQAQGLTCGPRCNAAERWRLVEATAQLVLHDRDILKALARAPLRQLELARRVNVCSLTAKHRLGLLIARGLVVLDVQNFSITATGQAGAWRRRADTLGGPGAHSRLDRGGRAGASWACGDVKRGT